MRKENFNNDWMVATTGNMVGVLLGEEQLPPQKVTLPHDAMITRPRDKMNASQNSGAFYPGGDYTYTKKFHVPEEDKKRRYVVEFEGLYENGFVYVNDNYVGSVDYGYTRLILDITDYLEYGWDNDIVVKTYNSAQPNTRWYTGSGIYRPVTLHIGNEIRIPVDGVKISTPQVAEDIAQVCIRTQLVNDTNSAKQVMVTTTIEDAEEKNVAVENTPVTILSHSQMKIQQNIYLREPALWSPEEPNLYVATVKVSDQEIEVDQTKQIFGIRKLSLDPVHGLQVNNRQILLRGACIHHDHGILGTAAFADAEYRKIKLLKAAGFNAVRIAHHSATKALLDACDELGMLVLDEVFDVWNHCKTQYDYSLRFEKNWERDITDLVTKDYNHPSVFMYSYGNEIQELAKVTGRICCHKLANKIQELDDTRYITNSINGLSALEELNGQIAADLGVLSQEVVDAVMNGTYEGDINDLMTEMHGAMNMMATHPMIEEAMMEAYSCLDACGLNYMRDCYQVYAERYPNRITFGSETLPPDIGLNWEQVKKISSCIGDFTWTGWDYLGEAGVGVVGYDGDDSFFKPYPAYLANVGDIDITGFRRPASYYREIVFGMRKEPYLAVQNPVNYGRVENRTPWTSSDGIASWSWPGMEGRMCRLEIFSPDEEVELRVNGKSAGRYATGADNEYKAVAEIPYEPGVIEAIGYSNGEKGRHFKLTTVQTDAQIVVACDRKELVAGEQSLAYLMITIEDEKGVVHTEKEQKIKVTVKGAATLMGIGSADPLSEENFYDTERTTYYGRAQAIIRSSSEPGEVEVIIESTDCEKKSLKLETVSNKNEKENHYE